MSHSSLHPPGNTQSRSDASWRYCFWLVAWQMFRHTSRWHVCCTHMPEAPYVLLLAFNNNETRNPTVMPAGGIAVGWWLGRCFSTNTKQERYQYTPLNYNAVGSLPLASRPLRKVHHMHARGLRQWHLRPHSQAGLVCCTHLPEASHALLHALTADKETVQMPSHHTLFSSKSRMKTIIPNIVRG
jgi:hypothetical protein